MHKVFGKYRICEIFLVFSPLIIAILLFSVLEILTVVSWFYKGGHPPFATVPFALNIVSMVAVFPAFLLITGFGYFYLTGSGTPIIPQWKFALAFIFLLEILSILNINFMFH